MLTLTDIGLQASHVDTVNNNFEDWSAHVDLTYSNPCSHETMDIGPNDSKSVIKSAGCKLKTIAVQLSRTTADGDIETKDISSISPDSRDSATYNIVYDWKGQEIIL